MARILGCQAKEPFANVGALSDIESCQSQALEGAKPRLAQKMICASHPFGHNSGVGKSLEEYVMKVKIYHNGDDVFIA